MNKTVRIEPFSFGAGLLFAVGTIVAWIFLGEPIPSLSGIVPDMPWWTYYPAAIILLTGYAWSVVFPHGKGEPYLSGIDDLATRMSATFPCARNPIEGEVLDINDWLVTNVAVSSLGSDSAVLQSLARELHPWEGTDAEIEKRGHYSILLALFSIRATADSDTYYKFRNLVSTSAPVRKSFMKAIDFGKDNVWRNNLPLQVSRMIETGTMARDWLDKQTGSNGTSVTVLMGVLAAARVDASLPETDFSWLSEVNPYLALALNAVGRPSFLPGSLGAASHFAAETQAGTAIILPDCTFALDAIRKSGTIWRRGRSGCPT